MASRVISVTVTNNGLMEILFEDNPADDAPDHGTVEEQVSDMLKPHVKKYGFIPNDWDRAQVEEEFHRKDEES
jgi:hypothetical protein